MKNRYRIVPATLEHVEELFFTMRDVDAEGLIAAGHSSAVEGLLEVFRRSQYAWAALDWGGVMAVWGFFTPTLLSGRATPWLVGTDRMTDKDNVRAFLRECKSYLTFAKDKYDALEAYQLVSRSEFLPWLRYCGFDAKTAKRVTVLGQEYYYFRQEIKPCQFL